MITVDILKSRVRGILRHIRTYFLQVAFCDLMRTLMAGSTIHSGFGEVLVMLAPTNVPDNAIVHDLLLSILSISFLPIISLVDCYL